MSAKKSQRHMRVTVLLSPAVASLLATLDEKGDVKAVIYELIDHAQQGVYRSGAWEREWKKIMADGWENVGTINVKAGEKLKPFADKAEAECREVQFFAASGRPNVWEVWMSPKGGAK